jgi:hypothetical protein
MNYECPKCKLNLQHKILPTKAVGDKKVFGFVYQRAMSCPNCETLLEYSHKDADQSITNYILGPLIFGIIALISNLLWLRYMAGFSLFIGIAYTAFLITSPNYKNKAYFKVYTKKS